MSRGKYSPVCPHANTDYEFKYNADRQIPPEYKKGEEFNERLHLDGYDEEGFDRYGYSAFDADGNYIGIGSGIDRLGYTEIEYLTEFTDEEFWYM